MIDFVEYLRAKLNALSDSTYTIGVYDEVNYNFENPEDIVFIYSGNAIAQADYSKKTYTQTFTLSVYTEKDGFDYANNLALELFKSINNETTTINGYITRIEIQSPVVLNVYGLIQDGLNNTLQLTGVLHLTWFTELALGGKWFLNGYQINPINPIVQQSVNSNTENNGGVGNTHANYYQYEYNFSIWDDDSPAALDLRDCVLGMNTQTFDFQIIKGQIKNSSGVPVLSDSEDWIEWFEYFDTQDGAAIKNTNGSAFALTRKISGHGEIVIYYNGVEQTADTVNIPKNYYLKLCAVEEVYDSTDKIYYCVLLDKYTAISTHLTDLTPVIAYAEDTQSGLATFNVKLVV